MLVLVRFMLVLCVRVGMAVDVGVLLVRLLVLIKTIGECASAGGFNQ